MSPPYGTTVPGNRWDLAGSAASGLRVSVVVSHYEQPGELARTLAALERQTRRPDEVVVADDGSRVAPDVPDDVRLVRQDDRGFRLAAARNLGVAASTGDVVVLLDADTVPEPGYVAAMADLPSRLPECLVVGRRRHADLADVPLDAPIEVAGPAHELPEPGWLRQAYATTRDLLDADHTGHRFAVGAVLACSRWWWDELGGCDESFTSYGGEDWDLAQRSWRAGGLLAHRADAVAWHDGPDAGARGRSAASELGETVAVADHGGAPGTTWRGLLRGPADLVVTVDGGLEPAAVLASLDGLLAAVPRARVELDDEHRRLVGDDPRVHPQGRAPSTARLHLHLREGLLGDPAAWLAVLDGLDGHACRAVGTDGSTVEDLRLTRRAARWERPEIATTHPAVDRRLTPWRAGHTLEAWLGGWAT
ncbi:glycosyltransferase [Nocardioides sp. C4-1]|uniref:glycosyltransferase n=1 Tax=Nocardioides sp. C4-1 TaxID=3151851 RepID=UPI0032675804